MSGLIRFMEMTQEDLKEKRKTAMKDKVGNKTVDTCDTFDCGWETGIEKESGKWVIVETYKNIKEAIIGHNKWINKLRDNPEIDIIECRGAMEWALGD